jgi:hypothetical protein
MIKRESVRHFKGSFMSSPRKEMGKTILFPGPRAQRPEAYIEESVGTAELGFHLVQPPTASTTNKTCTLLARKN